MAVASDILTAVRTRIHDATATYAISDDEGKRHYDDQVQLIGAELGLGQAWDVDAITLVAGTWDYELPTVVEYERILELRYVTDREPIRHVSHEVISDLRIGDTKPTGRPTLHSFRQEADWHVQAEFWPCPTVGEVVEALISLRPTIWGAGSAPTVPLSSMAIRALELRIATAMISAAGPEVIVQIGADKESISLWLAQAAELVRQERLSIIRFKRAHGPYNYRWAASWYAT